MTAFFTAWLADYGIIALFLLIYINGLCMPLIPADSLVLAAALLADKGKINLDIMLLAAFCGTVLGSMSGYFLGQSGGHNLLARIARLLLIKPKKFAAFEKKLRAKGFYFVMIARFIPGLRELCGLICGSMNMPFKRYMAGNLIGAFLWILCWGFLPYAFGHIVF